MKARCSSKKKKKKKKGKKRRKKPNESKIITIVKEDLNLGSLYGIY